MTGTTDGTDSADPSARVVFVFSLLKGELDVDGNRGKTHRWLRGRAHSGHVTGLLPYGCRSERDPAFSASVS
jgi:hypothetical protein